MSSLTKFYTKLKQKKFDFSSVNRRFSLVFFSVIAAFLFLNFFQPFGLYYDKSISSQEVFVELFIAMTLAFVVLVISQFVLKPLFKIYQQPLYSLLLWFLFEAVLVSTAWSFMEIIAESVNTALTELLIVNFIAYILIIILPYFSFITFIYYKDELMSFKENKVEQPKVQYITIKDESGEERLVVDIENILFIKSADNYVEINFIEDDSPIRQLIRNSIKNLEEDFKDTPLIRCHRSFMINTTKIESAKKTTAGFEIKMHQNPNSLIPVSRSYVSEIKKHLS